jgi:hypothetical protein
MPVCGEGSAVDVPQEEAKQGYLRPVQQGKRPTLEQPRKKRKAGNLSRVKVVVPQMQSEGAFASPSGTSPSSMAPSPGTPTEVRYRGVSKTVRGVLLLPGTRGTNPALPISLF